MATPSAYTILVIDSEFSTFERLETLLHQDAYTLSYLAPGDEVTTFLQLAREDIDAVSLPDVILIRLDPSLDAAASLCRRIKEESHFQYIPVVGIFEDASDAFLAAAIACGADDGICLSRSDDEVRSRIRVNLRIKQHYDTLLNTLQMREDLSNMVVHDLRNPVTNILLSAQILMAQGTFHGKDYDRLQLIQASSKALRSMLDDLLTVAKMQSGQLVLRRSEINLNLLLPYVVETMGAIAEERQIQIQTRLTGEGAFRSLDAKLVQRMLENLLSNALKFSPPGSTVTVSVDYLQTSNIHTRIQVCDEGPGIAASAQDAIFNKFSIGQPISGVSQIGLGLTFCKLVAEAHGGQIRVEPNPPRGSKFIVEL